MSTKSNRNFAIAAAASLGAAAVAAIVVYATAGATARDHIPETTVRIGTNSPMVAMHSAAQASIEELRQSLEIDSHIALR